MKRRYHTRIRPGGHIISPTQLLRKLGGDASKLVVESQGNRLIVSRRQTAIETRGARLKTRISKKWPLFELLMQMPDVGRDDDFERLS